MNHTLVNDSEAAKIISENLAEISGYNFGEVDFTEMSLKGAVFLDCKFSKCNFTNTSLTNVTFRGVVFEDCNLMGTNWTEVRKGGDFSFMGSKLDYCCFQSVDLRGVSFENCMIREADFSGANLSKAQFRGANLSATSFNNANLEKADFRGARGYFIDPKFAKIKEAQFSFPEAMVLIEAMGAKVEF